MRAFIVALVLTTCPAMAETILSPEEFEQYARNHSLYFATDGSIFGVEEYLPDRQTRWKLSDGQCMFGMWEARKKNQICFAYDGSDEEFCWQFIRRDDGSMIARAYGAEPEFHFEIIWRDQLPVSCKTTKPGV